MTFIGLVAECVQSITVSGYEPGQNTRICNPVYKFLCGDKTPKLGEDDDLVLQDDGHGDDAVTRSQGAYLWSLYQRLEKYRLVLWNKLSIKQRRERECRIQRLHCYAEQGGLPCMWSLPEDLEIGNKYLRTSERVR